METIDQDTLHARATEELAAGRAQASLALWDQLLAAYPAAVNARYNRGLALESLGRSADAAAAFADYLERSPDDVDGLVKYGKHARVAGSRAPARMSLDRAIALAPERADAYAHRALVALDLGDNAAAQADCDAAIRCGLDAGWLRYNRALACRRQGDRAGAVRDLDRAIELDPRDADFWALRGTLRLELGDDGGGRDRAEAVRLDPTRAPQAAAPAADSLDDENLGREVAVGLGGFAGMVALLFLDILLLIHVVGPLSQSMPYVGWPLVVVAGLAFFPIALGALSFKIRFAVALFPWVIGRLFALRRGRRLVGAGIAGAGLYIAGNLGVALWQGTAHVRSPRDLIAGVLFLSGMLVVGAVMMVSDADELAER